nr:hypothetical protein [Tanacetum cinerariifolium]
MRVLGLDDVRHSVSSSEFMTMHRFGFTSIFQAPRSGWLCGSVCFFRRYTFFRRCSLSSLYARHRLGCI